MFCPQCGSTQSDELKFCKSCGANLSALRQLMASRESDDKFDWNKTWLAEMFMSGDESAKRAAEIERRQGVTPETKRRAEIKAGIITSSVGIGLMVVLSVLMEGIIISGGLSDLAAEILSRVWIVGVIPLLVGIALVINGVLISKRHGESDDSRAEDKPADALDSPAAEFIGPGDTKPLVAVPLSVTEETTKHLKVQR